jgi:hypothetical protein
MSQPGGRLRRHAPAPVHLRPHLASISILAARKSFQIYDQHRIELRVTSTSFFSNPMFYFGDVDINSVNFGRICSLMTSPRRIQFELFYRF